MNLQKPIWLVFVAVIALSAFQVGFKPVKMAKKEMWEAVTPLKVETEQSLLGAKQEPGEVQKHLRDVWDKATDDPQGLSKVEVESDKLVRFDVVAINREQYDQYADQVTKALEQEYGKVNKVESIQTEEKYAAKFGPFALYWPPRPAINLGLDLRGGSRIVLQMMPTTMWTFTSERTPFFAETEAEAKGILLEELATNLKERKFEQVEVEAPNANKLTVSLVTPKPEDVKAADAVVTGLIAAKFPEAEKKKSVSATIDQATAEGVMGVVEGRVNGMGVSEATVQRQGTDRVVVSLPGVEDPAHALKVLGTLAKLEFRYISSKKYEVHEGEDGGLEFTKRDTQQAVSEDEVLASSEYILGGSDLKNNSGVTTGAGGGWVVTFEFKPAAAPTFSNFTRKNIGQFLAIVLDGKIKSAPVIKSHIAGAGIIEGLGSLQEAKDLKNWLNAGALPVPLKVAERTTVSATLGSDTVRSSLHAGLLGVLAVMAFMMLYYRACGALADLALGVYILLSLAVMSSVGVVLTLPGIAGLLLSVGMAVDANVIIFERLKEELRVGRSIGGAVEAGFRRAWTAIFDCNLTTLLACLALGIFGSGAVRGFAVTLGIGVICSFFSAVTVTKIFVHWAAKSRGLTESPLFTRR